MATRSPRSRPASRGPAGPSAGGVTRRTFLTAAGVGASVPLLASEQVRATARAVSPEAAATSTKIVVRLTEGTNLSSTPGPDGTGFLDLQGVLWRVPAQGGQATPITDATLEPARPDWSPRAGLLAFQAFETGNYHVYVCRPDGSGLRRLTDGPFDDREAAWSPDGRRIAFASDRAEEGSYDIWAVDLADGKLERLTSGTTNDYAPTWSADGGSLSFVRDRTTLARVGIGGQDAAETVRTAPAGSRFERPSLSPDGLLAYLVFADAGGTGELHVDGRRVSGTEEDVFIAPPRWLDAHRLLYTADGVVRVRDLRSGTVKGIPFTANFEVERETYTLQVVDPLSTGPSSALGLVTPRISPDGATLAFIALNRIWLRRGNRSPQEILDPGPAYTVGSLSWARDGRSLLYSCDREGLLAIYRYDLRSRRSTRLTELPGAQFDPALSPDGTRLAFQDERNSIRVLDLDSGEHRVVADPVAGRERVGPPSWSPDGRFIAYNDRNTINTRFREGYNQIKVVDVATGTVQRMYSPVPHGSLSDRGDCGPVWSPDGRWMAFVMESALWVLPVTPEGAPAGEPRRLTSDAADAPSWAADSRTLWHLAGRRLRRVDVPTGRSTAVPAPRIPYRRERPAGTVRVHAGRLWDGTGDAPRDDVDVFVGRNRIVAVKPHTSASTTDQKDERFVDASEQTVLPGLWDCHNHPTEQQAFGGRYFGLMLAYGITTNISMGSIAYEGLNHRESLASGDLVGGRHFTTGELFDGTRTSHPPTRAFATMEGLDRSLRRAHELRYDYIKTYVRTPMPMMERAAHVSHADLGVPSGTHLLAQGLSAGLDMITHLSATQRLEYSYSQSPAGHIYQDVAALVGTGKFRVIVTPFDSLLYVTDDPRLRDDPRVRTLMPPWTAALLTEQPDTPELRQALAAEIGAYKRLLAAGGILIAGSDAPIVPPGISLHTAMRAMVRGGIPLADVLRTATVWPAKIMGVADRLGTVQAGKIADLTFVDGDPFANIDDLVRTSRVMTNGRLVTQEQIIAPFTDEGAGPALKRTLAGVSAAHWGAVGRAVAADACCARR